MARVLLLDMPELGPGQTAAARFRLEAPLVALPGDRFVVRSYSPSVTIGGGTILDVDPARFKLRAPIHLAHLKLLQEGSPEEVVEEHVRHVGGSGARLATLLGRVPFGPEKLRGLLDGLVAQGRVLVVDREWYLHSESSARLRALVLAALEAFHRANPLKPGMSREELRVRTGGADERVFATLLAALEAEGALASDRDKVRLASHQVRLTPEQQRIVDRVEQEFRKAEASPPKGASHVWAGLSGATDHPRDRADPLRRQPVAGSGAVAGIERQGIQERRQRGDEGRRDRRQEGRRKEGVVTRSAGRSTASISSPTAVVPFSFPGTV